MVCPHVNKALAFILEHIEPILHSQLLYQLPPCSPSKTLEVGTWDYNGTVIFISSVAMPGGAHAEFKSWFLRANSRREAIRVSHEELSSIRETLLQLAGPAVFLSIRTKVSGTKSCDIDSFLRCTPPSMLTSSNIFSIFQHRNRVTRQVGNHQGDFLR